MRKRVFALFFLLAAFAAPPAFGQIYAELAAVGLAPGFLNGGTTVWLTAAGGPAPEASLRTAHASLVTSGFVGPISETDAVTGITITWSAGLVNIANNLEIAFAGGDSGAVPGAIGGDATANAVGDGCAAYAVAGHGNWAWGGQASANVMGDFGYARAYGGDGNMFGWGGDAKATALGPNAAALPSAAWGGAGFLAAALAFAGNGANDNGGFAYAEADGSAWAVGGGCTTAGFQSGDAVAITSNGGNPWNAVAMRGFVANGATMGTHTAIGPNGLLFINGLIAIAF